MRLQSIVSGTLALILGFTAATAPGWAQTPPQAAFTDSAAAGLAATKRVAISSVIVSFQASVADEAGPGAMLRMFQSKETAQSVLAMPDLDPALQAAVVQAVYAQLQADLTAAGFEVVPEAEVKANASYQQIQKLAGMPASVKFANAGGDALLVSPASLPGYLPYVMETGPFTSVTKTYLGWTSAMGAKSITPGGPSLISLNNNWKIPGLEVQMAKDLNANVVKAFYVVTIGKAEVSRRQSFDTVSGVSFDGALVSGVQRTVSANGSAFAQLGLLPDQTRIAFRTPGGNAKWQKVSTGKPVPAKDGDVVVRLAEPMLGGTDFFSVTGASQQKGLFGSGADFKFSFTVQVNDPAAYGREVVGMLTTADRAMIALVKP
jgi:hypothetical protein